jgi:periplasmic divalent cation tolerance protein
MRQPEYIVVLITVEDAEEAEHIAELLLEQRMAACVNIIPGINSSFWWEGKIDKARESLLIIKTEVTRLQEIIHSVKTVHSNTVPEIIALPIIGGNQDYLDWIDNEVSETGETG